ncbi:MAG TPA: DNA-3-methyladenine glycosylase I [Armatimonadota bacterium]|nr:DNA-3-methyladenine glycosylase I [Armatimonadota bacterium]
MTVSRCAWVPQNDPCYLAYHDTEWGVPVHDDRLLFEYLVLEGAQAGLSWQIVLRKRENYRRAFDEFDIARVAGYDAARVEALVQNAGIIRHRKKIAATITLARIVLDIQREVGSLDAFLWSFVDNHPHQPHHQSITDIPTRSTASDAMSAALRARGASFVGSTICYSFMQAVGMVNDHTIDCFRHTEICSMTS